MQEYLIYMALFKVITGKLASYDISSWNNYQIFFSHHLYCCLEWAQSLHMQSKIIIFFCLWDFKFLMWRRRQLLCFTLCKGENYLTRLLCQEKSFQIDLDPHQPPKACPFGTEQKKNKYLDIQATPNIAQENDEATNSQIEQGFFSTLTIPFILQLGFMISVASFGMHVQVATRFLSVSPPIYWYPAHEMGSSRTGFKLGYVLWAVFLSYLFFGSLLFSNFYPFTWTLFLSYLATWQIFRHF